MNQTWDIKSYLAEFQEERNRLNKVVAELTTKVSCLNRSNEAKDVTIRDLKSRVKDLEKRLSKYEDPAPRKNSSNSSVPPSKESVKDEVNRRTTSLREKSGKKSGGQPNHPGNTRLKARQPDVIEDHLPHYCNQCGRDLSDITGDFEYEEESVGFKIVPITTRHRYLSKRCTCGCCNKLNLPRRKNPVYLASEVRTLVVYLNVVMCMPYNRIKAFLHDMLKIDISEGSIRNFIKLAGRKAEPVCEKISKELLKSPVGGADETGCYVNGKLNWAWILQNPKLTLTWIAKGRAAQEIKDKFGEDALENMVLTTDRHSAYFTLKVRGRQLCLAHILRNLNYLNELDKTQTWSPRMQELLRSAIHWRNENPGVAISAKTWYESLDKLLNEDLEKFKKPVRSLRKGLLKKRDYFFTFLEEPEVPCHNNASEGGIRILKVKQKISGGFRSPSGAEEYMAIHSVTDTAKKNQYSRWDAVRALVD